MVEKIPVKNFVDHGPNTESGKNPDDCQKQLQAACKGLAIGKYCGMKHEH